MSLVAVFDLNGLIDQFETPQSQLEASVAEARRTITPLSKRGAPGAIVVYDSRRQTTSTSWNELGSDSRIGRHIVDWLTKSIGSSKALVDWIAKNDMPAVRPKNQRGPVVLSTSKSGVKAGKPKKRAKPAGEPTIEFGSGKNKNSVSLTDARKMASQLEAVSRESKPRSTPKPRASSVHSVLDAVRARPVAVACRPKFKQGLIRVSMMAQAIASEKDITRAFKRFGSCDWGDVSSTVARRNNLVTRKRRGMLRGKYETNEGVFVIHSRLNGSANSDTAVLVPEEAE